MNLDEALQLLAQNPAAELDVAEVALLLAREEYPKLDVEGCLSEIDAMAHEARSYVRGDLDGKLTGLCRYLFHEMGFRGNLQNYYDPANSYFNLVLERRTGIPISLTAVAMAVGNRAGLRVEGVGLPGHFIAKAVAGEHELLFDPFHGGRRLWRRDCENLVRQVTKTDFEATPENLRALPLGLMVQRMLNNLKAVYLGQPDFERGVRIIRRLRQLTPHDAQQDRDLGACYLRLGQHGKALTHLEAYLRNAPGATDEREVRQLVLQARREIAQWN
jgi:regulator of sirC expression with transglutaminase-like and TPR domain